MQNYLFEIRKILLLQIFLEINYVKLFRRIKGIVKCLLPFVDVIVGVIVGSVQNKDDIFAQTFLKFDVFHVAILCESTCFSIDKGGTHPRRETSTSLEDVKNDRSELT